MEQQTFNFLNNTFSFYTTSIEILRNSITSSLPPVPLGGDVVEGSEGERHHRAHEADDVVGHGEVRRRQTDQLVLRGETDEHAVKLRGRTAGGTRGDCWNITRANMQRLKNNPSYILWSVRDKVKFT